MKTLITLPEHTIRFFVVRDPDRRGIDGKPSRIVEIMYEDREFAHAWDIRGWEPENEGKWTLNRSDVCLANEWWPSVYMFDTLQDMLDHLEKTFVEGVPANKPVSIS